jgi:hypothetical protein
MTAMTKPKFTYDEAGNEIEVTIPAAEYKALLEELEDSENQRLYDEAKQEDTDERISLSQMKEHLGICSEMNSANARAGTSPAPYENHCL